MLYIYCINHLSNNATELFPLKTSWVRPKVRQDVEALHIIYIVAYYSLQLNIVVNFLSPNHSAEWETLF